VNRRLSHLRRLFCFAPIVLLAAVAVARGELPNPVLNSVFPPGGQVGKTVLVTVAGSGLDRLTTLRCSHSGITFEKVDANRFRITIPKDVPPGSYDLRTVGRNGLSAPRTFFISNRPELLETEPNETLATAQSVPLDVVINGRIEKGGDLDQFRFAAKQGQRVVVECLAERIDSRLRAVLELYDGRGHRLAVNRGYFGIDPLIDFRVPADGTYVVKLFDLIYSGSAEHFYRLAIDTGPRVAFAVPPVVERGRTTRVTLFGWNLRRDNASLVTGVAEKSSIDTRGPSDRAQDVDDIATSPQRKQGNRREQSFPRTKFDAFDRVEVDVTPADGREMAALPVRLRPSQIAVDGFAYHYPGGHAPILIGTTDVPVIKQQAGNHSAAAAQEIDFPCEVVGQLVAGDERDWYQFRAKRGEVLWIEAFGRRIDSPVDLDLSLLDSASEKELARFSDEVKNIGGKRFPSSHLDPAGRWIAPTNGSYLIMVRNLFGGLDDDPRRVYRLSVRREVSDFQLAIVPRHDGPAALNLSSGGRLLVDVLAFRRRGMTGSIRVTAKNLPGGINCPDIWLGPGVDRAPLTISAEKNTQPFVGTLDLAGDAASLAGSRPARGGTVVRTGLPNGSGRLTAGIPFAVRDEEAPLRITANGHETRDHHLYGKLTVRHSPGSILDVAVRVDRRDPGHRAPVKLIGVGIPARIQNQTATIPAGRTKGYVSFYLPPTLPPGRYTIAVRAETTVPASPTTGKKNQPPKTVTVYSDPVTFHVRPAAFAVEIDPYAPKKVRRGQIVKINYTARRTNGFIGKIHTELAAPEKVVGLRGRGVTFVGQTESGVIQIIAGDDAPLGLQPFVRFYAVGVVEDQPVFHGSCFLNLEIVE
jgi:hypothetical protein